MRFHLGVRRKGDAIKVDLSSTARTATQSESLGSGEDEQEFYTHTFPSRLVFCDLQLSEHLTLNDSV